MCIRDSGIHDALVTLHLPPPLILTFSISFEEPSRIIILLTPFSAALTAVMKPAAPPPTTTKSKGFKNVGSQYFPKLIIAIQFYKKKRF